MSNPRPELELARVEQAATDVRASRTAYREALARAHEAGVPVATIARAAGVSRQAVYALIERSARRR
jgi:ABC-type sugar transport system substrate-binding protein